MTTAKSHIANIVVCIGILPIIYLCVGCSTLFAPQSFSENYSLGAGVQSDAPEAIDGDMDTISNNTRIMISLPEMKSIRKVIIYSPNISNFVIYESLGEEGKWRPIKSIKGNKLDKIIVNTQVRTDKIRIFVSDTRGTRFAEPGAVRDVNGDLNAFSRQVDARPIVREIELYGLVDIDKPEEDEDEFIIDPKAPLF